MGRFIFFAPGDNASGFCQVVGLFDFFVIEGLENILIIEFVNNIVC